MDKPFCYSKFLDCRVTFEVIWVERLEVRDSLDSSFQYGQRFVECPSDESQRRLSRTLGVQELNVLIERIGVFDGNRLPNSIEFICQEVAELNEGDCLGLERAANVADFLDEFHVSFWQSEPAQCLLWQGKKSVGEYRAETHRENFNEGAIFLFDTVG